MPRSARMKSVVLISALMVTQTIGWGGSFSLISVLAEPIHSELALPRSTIYLGATVMYLTAAATAPFVGRLADRVGGLRCLCAGSVMLAAALGMLSQSASVTGYLLAWALFGLAMHVGLATAAYASIGQTLGKDAQRGISTLTVVTGLASSIFWPLSEALLHVMDWRSLCLTYAAVTLGFCLPVHLMLAWRFGLGGRRAEAALHDNPPHVAPGSRERSFQLIVLVNTIGSIITIGVAVMTIDLFVALGASRQDAILAGVTIGFANVAARGFATLLGDRAPQLTLAQLVYFCLPLSLAPLLTCAAFGLALPGWLAVATAAIYGFPAGLVSILKPSIPLYFFGAVGYGGVLGRQSRALDIASALTPAALAWLLDLSAALAVSSLMLLGLAAMVATLMLSRHLRAA